MFSFKLVLLTHGLRTPREQIAFTARPKIHSHSQIFRYGGSIFCLPHRPNFSDIFDFCLHWVSVLRALTYSMNGPSKIFPTVCVFSLMYFHVRKGADMKYLLQYCLKSLTAKSLTKKINPKRYLTSIWCSATAAADQRGEELIFQFILPSTIRGNLEADISYLLPF